MARIRTIKPDFFTDTDIAELDPMTRLFFIGLWCVVDREGRAEDNPKRLKALVFPYDDFDAELSLDDLEQRKFIDRYEVDGRRYLLVRTFAKHQRPHMKEAPSVLPPPQSREKVGASREKVGASTNLFPASREKVVASREKVVASTLGREGVLGKEGVHGNGEWEGKVTEPGPDTHRERVDTFDSSSAWDEVQRRYPQERVTRGYMTQQLFTQAIATPDDWNAFCANLEANISSHEWRVKRMVPRLEKYLRDGLWRNRLPAGPPGSDQPFGVSTKTAGNLAAAQAWLADQREGAKCPS